MSGLERAKGFSITYGTNQATVTVGSTNYLIYPCNHPAPTSAPGTQVIQVPVFNVAVSAPGIITYLERLGARSTIRYADPTYLTSACLESAASGIRGLPAPAVGADVNVNFGTDIQSAIATEASPLARGEWIKFFDAFLGFTGNSQREWNNMKSQYECVQKSTLNPVEVASVAVSSATAKDGGFVLTAPNAEFWNTLIKDAGAQPLSIGSGEVSLDSWKNVVKNADAVFDLTPFRSDVEFDLKNWSSIYQLTPADSGYYFLKGINSFIFRLDKRINTRGHDG
jgi:hypothetical protein